MTENARENILSKLRQSKPSQVFAESDYSILAQNSLSARDKISRYRSVCEAVNTQVHEVERQDWLGDVAKILQAKGVRHMLYGPNGPLGRNIEEKWNAQAVKSDVKLVPYNIEMENCKDMLFDIDASITSTLGAVAQTGSLILWPSREEPRLLSLVAPVHVAIVSADQFYTTFFEAIERNDWATNMPTNALLISGPSKTADIEQELCYGVHGPKELIVFIVH